MMRVNLLQPRIPSREALVRKRLRVSTTAVVGLAIASALALVWILFSRWALSDQLEAVQAQIAAEQSRVAEARSLLSAIREAEARTKLLQQLPKREDRFAQLITKINGVRPAGVQLNGITIQSDGSVFIAGTANSHQLVADYLDRLRLLSGLSGMTFDSSTRTGENQQITFVFRGTLASPAAAAAEAEGGDVQ
ncbi:MAG TPA: PilN domain-containing protein [Symbiobacteriaceae bacterium]